MLIAPKHFMFFSIHLWNFFGTRDSGRNFRNTFKVYSIRHIQESHNSLQNKCRIIPFETFAYDTKLIFRTSASWPCMRAAGINRINIVTQRLRTTFINQKYCRNIDEKYLPMPIAKIASMQT